MKSDMYCRILKNTSIFLDTEKQFQVFLKSELQLKRLQNSAPLDFVRLVFMAAAFVWRKQPTTI